MGKYEVREWSMRDARTGGMLRGYGVYWWTERDGLATLPLFTAPRRETCVRWASQHNKRIAAKAAQRA